MATWNLLKCCLVAHGAENPKAQVQILLAKAVASLILSKGNGGLMQSTEGLDEGWKILWDDDERMQAIELALQGVGTSLQNEATMVALRIGFGVGVFFGKTGRIPEATKGTL